jgi:hypothetical protein
MQTFILAKLIDERTFKIKLYMDKVNSSVKVDRIKELARKMILFGSNNLEGNRAAFEENIEMDMEKINLHLSMIEFACVCSENNYYAVKQLR